MVAGGSVRLVAGVAVRATAVETTVKRRMTRETASTTGGASGATAVGRLHHRGGRLPRTVRQLLRLRAQHQVVCDPRGGRGGQLREEVVYEDGHDMVNEEESLEGTWYETV